MLTRNFFVNAHEPDGDLSKKIPEYMSDLLIKAKKISQIITYIWAFQDEVTCMQLTKYFENPNDKEHPLSELLFAQPNDFPYIYLLQKVFDLEKFPTALPIFKKDEKSYYNFQVVYSGFEGYIGDPARGEDAIITMVIPFPPRPRIYDGQSKDLIAKGAPLKISDLEDWLQSCPNEAPFYYQKNPYIPTTCC